MTHHKKQSGFALLMTLIVVSVVITIGLTLIDLTLKQLKLSTNSKDSESSFHAANAGVECARYWRLKEKAKFESVPPDVVPVVCFGQSAVNTTVSGALSTGVYQHDFEISWSGATRCSKVRMITFSSNPSDAPTTLINIPTLYIPGYPTNSKTCNPGGRCTIISVQGYNKACTQITQLGTIQREVLLEL